MKTLLLLILSIPLVSMANNSTQRETMEDNLLQSLKETRLEVTQNLQKIPLHDIQKVEALLGQVREIATGIASPIGAPKAAQRLPQICSQDNVDTFQSTFITIRELAFSRSGLNLSKSESIQFATSWTNQFPCDFVEKYTENLNRVKNFAVSSKGLNLSSSDASSYAQNMTTKICENIDFETLFKKHFNFAFSRRGMSMSSAEARAYSKPKVEAEAFVCSK